MLKPRSHPVQFLVVFLVVLSQACQKNEVQGLTTQDLTSPSCQLRTSNYLFDAGSKWIYQNDSSGELLEVRVRTIKLLHNTSSSLEGNCRIESLLTPDQFSYIFSDGHFSRPATDSSSSILPYYLERGNDSATDTLRHYEHNMVLHQPPRMSKLQIRLLTFNDVDEVIQFSTERPNQVLRRDYYSPRVGRIKWVQHHPEGGTESYSLISYQTIPWSE